MGMQCPPRPGPGRKLMKPNGFVAAAPTTSQTSMPIRSQSCASSLTSAMFTERKMFSSSFVNSAASGVETSTIVSTARRYTSRARRVHSGVIPPTTFGVVFVVQSERPGSTRSGDIARWNPSPAFNPEPRSRIGCSSSRVVPGHVLEVTLASVQRVDERLHDVDEEHVAAGLGEGDGERKADIAGPDYGDVVRHGAPA